MPFYLRPLLTLIFLAMLAVLPSLVLGGCTEAHLPDTRIKKAEENTTQSYRIPGLLAVTAKGILSWGLYILENKDAKIFKVEALKISLEQIGDPELGPMKPEFRFSIEDSANGTTLVSKIDFTGEKYPGKVYTTPYSQLQIYFVLGENPQEVKLLIKILPSPFARAKNIMDASLKILLVARNESPKSTYYLTSYTQASSTDFDIYKKADVDEDLLTFSKLKPNPLKP